jgi:anti-anti-sigma regulatory factor
VSLTVTNEVHDGIKVVRFGGAVDESVLERALGALRAAADASPLVIDLDDLTIWRKAPFDALLDWVRARGSDGVAIVCRRPTARQLLRLWGVDKWVPLYDSVDSVIESG